MSTEKRRRALQQLFYISLLLICMGEMAFGGKHLSLTSDEPPHIAHGYLMLKTGDTWALTEHRHPPFVNMLAALPLLFQEEQPDPTHVPFWHKDFVQYVRALWPLLGPVERLAYITRFPNILISILLAALVCRWARQHRNGMGALFAMGLLILDPTFIAHGQLNTTDVGLVFFATLTIYVADLPHFSTRVLNNILAGIALGCAIATKATGILLVPVVYVLLFLDTLKAPKRDTYWVQMTSKTNIRRWATSTLVVTASAMLVVILTYVLPKLLSGHVINVMSFIDHIKLLSATLTERNRTAFLAGELRQGGWWWYFPYAFVVKTPIPALILISSSCLSYFGKSKLFIEQTARWLFPAIYLIFAIRSTMNIGYRHLLPVFPFLYIMVGRYISHLLAHNPIKSQPLHLKHLYRKPFILRIILGLLLIWQVYEIITVFPFALAYFNQFAGGPENGYQVLVDSNVDWGQSFIALKNYMRKNNISMTYLSYYTWIDPAAYGVSYQPLPPSSEQDSLARRFNPHPGFYAISATTLQGVMVADPDMYDWFRHRTPTAQPGYGLLVYKVEPEDNGYSWVAQCIIPVAPLKENDITAGFGDENLRIINFDCSNAWIVPQQGLSPGWYVLHKELENADDDFIQTQLMNTKISYQQKEPALLPAFTIYEYDLKNQPYQPGLAVFGTNQLSLIGYRSPDKQDLSENQLDFFTIWSVTSRPDRPLSFMLHLTNIESGENWVGDGLGVPITEWREGDIIIQRHRIHGQGNISKGTYDVMVGVYWLDTLERWKVQSDEPVMNNAVRIMRMDIK